VDESGPIVATVLEAGPIITLELLAGPIRATVFETGNWITPPALTE